MEAAQKDLRGEAREESTSGGVLDQYVRLCENSETFKTVGIGNHIHDEINDLITKSISFMVQSGRT
jgi:hypothetical protein